MQLEEQEELVNRVADEVVSRIALGSKINELADQAISRMLGNNGCHGAPPALNTSDPPRKLILKCKLSPGDVLMLTAAVRDLHLSYPGQFLTDVRTPCPQLWDNNPYITPLFANDTGVESIDCEYPLIHLSNQMPYHFIHAYRMFLNKELELNIRPHGFKGDIHFRPEEREWMSQVDEVVGAPTRYWIIVAGGKRDFTNKIWDVERFQQVVDHFKGRITFVQVGEAKHIHPALNDVINLVGETDLRQLVRLMYHADGVVCGVTMLMHLAAAVQTKPDRQRNRPCVVLAGGREPAQWEAYPHHRFLHTHSSLPCCDLGGCWKSRIEPLGDGDIHDENLCVYPVETTSGKKLPKCLDLISAQDVIRAIELYLAFDDVAPEFGEKLRDELKKRPRKACEALERTVCHKEVEAGTVALI